MRLAVLLLSLSSIVCAAGFEPVERWAAAVRAGDAAALEGLYSKDPVAVAQIGNERVPDIQEELKFWASQKVSGFNPKVLQVSGGADEKRIVFRVVATSGEGALVMGMQQIWMRQPGGWALAASARSPWVRDAARQLPQPEKPNADLYPDPAEARAELAAAKEKAGREHKRVIVVFGGNWCYDCHVLDAAFHSKAFAALVDRNFEVVHVNIGEDGKENGDLAKELGVGLEKGVPSLGVLDADGTVVMAQKDGEFESTVRIGAAEIRAFLEKWKPARK